MSTPAPQDPRPGLPPYRLPRKPQEPLQECVCLPGPGPTLRLPPTPQGALFQRHRTPEGSGPIPLARTGCHPGNCGHGGGRGLLHRDAGPDAAGGHCQSRSAAPRSEPPPARERVGLWVLGVRQALPQTCRNVSFSQDSGRPCVQACPLLASRTLCSGPLGSRAP